MKLVQSVYFSCVVNASLSSRSHESVILLPNVGFDSNTISASYIEVCFEEPDKMFHGNIRIVKP